MIEGDQENKDNKANTFLLREILCMFDLTIKI